jgi:hypothetical protein
MKTAVVWVHISQFVCHFIQCSLCTVLHATNLLQPIAVESAKWIFPKRKYLQFSGTTIKIPKYSGFHGKDFSDWKIWVLTQFLTLTFPRHLLPRLKKWRFYVGGLQGMWPIKTTGTEEAAPCSGDRTYVIITNNDTIAQLITLYGLHPNIQLVCSLLCDCPTATIFVIVFGNHCSAVRFKAWVCSRSLAGIVSSNPARSMAGAWMSVACEFCVLSRRVLCVGLITHPEESYRV